MKEIFLNAHNGSVRETLSKIPQVERLKAALQLNEQDGLYLFSSGIEAVATVFNSIYEGVTKVEGRHHYLYTSGSNALLPKLAHSLKEKGCTTIPLTPSIEGYVPSDVILKALNPRCCLFSTSAANPLTGVIQPLSDSLLQCRTQNIFTHVDMGVAIGKLELPDADYVTFDGRWLGALAGSALLIVRNSAPVIPFFPQNLSSVNLPAFDSLTEAVLKIGDCMDYFNLEVARLKSLFEASILQHSSGAEILFVQSPRLSNTTCLSFEKVHGDALNFYLFAQKVYPTLCHDQYPLLSEQLLSSGFPERTAFGAISFSFPYTIQQEEIQRAALRVVQEVETLRRMTP